VKNGATYVIGLTLMKPITSCLHRIHWV